MNVYTYFEPRDLWVGVYWTYNEYQHARPRLNVYVCLVPTWVIQLVF